MDPNMVTNNAETEKKSNRRIALIIIIALLALCAIGVWGYATFINKGSDVAVEQKATQPTQKKGSDSASSKSETSTPDAAAQDSTSGSGSGVSDTSTSSTSSSRRSGGGSKSTTQSGTNGSNGSVIPTPPPGPTPDTQPPVIAVTLPTSWATSQTIEPAIVDNVAVTLKQYMEGTFATPAEFKAAAASAHTFTGSFKVTENGTYTIYAEDAASNAAVKVITIDKVDYTAPEITIDLDPEGWTNQTVSVEGSAEDTQSTVAVQKYAPGERDVAYFKTQGAVFLASFSATSNGTFTLYARDVAGNESIRVVTVGNIDKVAPTVDVPTYTSWVATQTVEPTITDSGSGVAVTKYLEGSYATPEAFTAAGSGIEFTDSFEVIENATYTVYAEDVAGNAAVKSFTLSKIDRVSPSIEATLSVNTWTNQNVVVTGSTEDTQSAVAVQKYAPGVHDAAEFDSIGAVFMGMFTVEENGEFTIYAIDHAGNTSVYVITVGNIDKVPPTAAPVVPTDWAMPLPVSTEATDTLSGIKVQKYAFDPFDAPDTDEAAAGTEYSGDVFDATQNGRYTIYIEDNAGNSATYSFYANRVDSLTPYSTANGQRYFDSVTMSNIVRRIYLAANTYSPNATVKLKNQYTMQIIRASRYSGGNWDVVCGAIDTNFKNYMINNQAELYGIFNPNGNNITLTDPWTKEDIDFVHMDATMNGVFNNGSTITADGTGWLGDLYQNPVGFGVPTGPDQETVTAVARQYVGNPDNLGAFGISDMLADVDAAVIAFTGRGAANSSIADIMLAFYEDPTATTATRYTKFIAVYGGKTAFETKVASNTTSYPYSGFAGLINNALLNALGANNTNAMQRQGLYTAFVEFIERGAGIIP